MIGRLVAVALVGTLLGPALADEIPREQRRSGYDALSPQTRAMQDNDSENPATLWALDGEAAWSKPEGEARKSCADCHGDAGAMKGVAARYPRFDAARGKPVDIEQQINICRVERQKASPLAFESHDLLALTTFVARESRGMPIAPDNHAGAAAVVAEGRRLFTERRGQLDLSCAQCHDDNWGKSLGGATIPQGQPNGYPLYRLEWQSVGSMRRRLRNCLSGMRAELPPADAPEYVALEMYLMSRAEGLRMESPAVRP
jgi:sulfur-oxidizing protein SoxA